MGGQQQWQDQRQQPSQPGQQDQQQQDAEQKQPDQQGQAPGEDGDQQGDPRVAANLQQAQQLLDGINALPLDGSGAALRAPLASALQLVLANQRELLGDTLTLREALAQERQRAHRAEEQLRDLVKLVRDAQTLPFATATSCHSAHLKLTGMRICGRP